MLSFEDSIRFLCDREFPGFLQLIRRRRLEAAVDVRSSLRIGAVTLPEGAKQKEDELIANYSRRFKELKARSPSEIESMVAQVKADEYRKSEEAEIVRRNEEFQRAESFFNNQTFLENLSFWAKKLTWTIDQAVALAFGKEPGQISSARVRPMMRVHRAAIRYEQMMELAAEHARSRDGVLSDPVKPSIFLAWAHRYEFPVPRDLVNAVARYDPSVQAIVDESVQTRLDVTHTAGIESKESIEKASKAPTQHKLKSRRHALDAVIALAEIAAINGADHHSVWAVLVALAEGDQPPPPVMGYVDNEGIKYRSDRGESGVKFFTKEALEQRYRRAANAAKLR